VLTSFTHFEVDEEYCIILTAATEARVNVSHVSTIKSHCLWSNGTDKTITNTGIHFQWKTPIWFKN